MNHKEFSKDFQKKGPRASYFFVGSELYYKNKAIEELVKVVPEGQRDFNVDLFHGGDSPLSEVISAARTLPFLASRRIVIFKDIERAKLGSDGGEKLAAYLAAPSPETVFVATTADAGAARTWSKKCAGLWAEVDFRPLKGPALAAAVKELAAARGARITGEAVERLLEMAGGDLSRLDQEIEKLVLASPPGAVIDGPAVGLMVGGYSFQNSFDLVKAIGDRDVRESLRLMDRLFVSGAEATGMVGMLAKRLRILWYLCPGGEGGAAAVPGTFKVQKWQLPELRRQAAAFSRGEVEGMLRELLRIDSLVKSAPLSSRLLLENFVLAMGARRGPARSR